MRDAGSAIDHQELVGPDEIAADGLVDAAPESVFAFLSDLENHWRLTGRCVEVMSLDGPVGGRHGGTVRIRGPLRVHRTARTRVLAASAPSYMVGRAEIGARTRGQVRWTLRRRGERTAVRLSATVEATARLDGLLLRLGGRRWLERLFAATLTRLADHFETGSPRARAELRRSA